MSTAGPHDPSSHRFALVVAAGNMLLFILMALMQWAAWGGADAARDPGDDDISTLWYVACVVLANVLYAIGVVAGTFATRPLSRPWWARLAMGFCLAAVLGMLRTAALSQVIPHGVRGQFFDLLDWLVSTATATFALAGAFLLADLTQKVRDEEGQRLSQAIESARTIEELEAEELAVRRAVSERLHGRVQNQLVVVAAGIERVVESLSGGQPDVAEPMRQWARTLDEIRDLDVRALSHELFPIGIDMGAVDAIAALLDRLPASVRGKLNVGERLRELLDRVGAVTRMPERLICFYTVEEALTNAIKHGKAQQIVVSIDIAPAAEPRWLVLRCTVDDDGTGLPAEGVPARSGLSRHASRIEARAGSLALTPSPVLGGARLSFELPFQDPT